MKHLHCQIRIPRTIKNYNLNSWTGSSKSGQKRPKVKKKKYQNMSRVNFNLFVDKRKLEVMCDSHSVIINLSTVYSREKRVKK